MKFPNKSTINRYLTKELMNNNEKIQYLIEVIVPISQLQSHERIMNIFLQNKINKDRSMKQTEYLSCKKVRTNEDIQRVL
jgi:hypothetical protein